MYKFPADSIALLAIENQYQLAKENKHLSLIPSIGLRSSYDFQNERVIFLPSVSINLTNFFKIGNTNKKLENRRQIQILKQARNSELNALKYRKIVEKIGLISDRIKLLEDILQLKKKRLKNKQKINEKSLTVSDELTAYLIDEKRTQIQINELQYQMNILREEAIIYGH